MLSLCDGRKLKVTPLHYRPRGDTRSQEFVNNFGVFNLAIQPME